jgi:hypothetical protein
LKGARRAAKMATKKKKRLQLLATGDGEIIGAAGVGAVKVGDETMAMGIRPGPGQIVHEVAVEEDVIKLMGNPEAFYLWCKHHYLTRDGQLKPQQG